LNDYNSDMCFQEIDTKPWQLKDRKNYVVGWRGFSLSVRDSFRQMLIDNDQDIYIIAHA